MLIWWSMLSALACYKKLVKLASNGTMAGLASNLWLVSFLFIYQIKLKISESFLNKACQLLIDIIYINQFF